MQNWKTTAGGIATLLTALGVVIGHIANGGFQPGTDIPTLMAGLAVFGLGWHAADK